MIVEDIMIREVVTLYPTDTIAAAINVLDENKIRHIPIVDHNQTVVGIISDRDIRDASPSIFHMEEHMEDLHKPIESIMKTEVITGHPLDFVEEISAVLYEHRISCMPITTGGKLVGIVTDTDLLHSFVELTGAHQPGSRIEVKVTNKAGMLSEVATLFKKKNINITSVLVYPDKDENYKVLVFRIQTMNPTGILQELKNNGYIVLWPGLSENRL